MADPAKLTLELRAITAKFQSDIKKAQKSVSTFSQNIKRSLNDAAAGASKGFKNVVRTDAYQTAAVAATFATSASGAEVSKHECAAGRFNVGAAAGRLSTRPAGLGNLRQSACGRAAPRSPPSR